jgi:hypothetical protein
MAEQIQSAPEQTKKVQEDLIGRFRANSNDIKATASRKMPAVERHP